MFLFLDSVNVLKNDELTLGGQTTVARRIWAALLSEERPRDMLLLLTILVALLHVWMLTLLMSPVEKTTQAVPLVMEVSMIAMSAPKPEVAPPKPVPPPPPPPPPEKKPPPKKIKPKPKPVKKPAPIVQKAPEFAPVEPIEPPPVQSTQSTSSASANTTAQTATSNPEPSFTEANFRANYAHNPKPKYPTIAKSRGWQGKVLLRVRVSAQGLSDSVAVEKSSGHEILDESAVEAVQKWRFIPAKRGDTPVASSVIVPIVFTLRN